VTLPIPYQDVREYFGLALALEKFCNGVVLDTRTPRYARFERTSLILRDELAIDRTLLANERTVLAYLRFGVALLIAGITMIHFAKHGWFMAMGIACLPVGAICGIVGIVRFWRMNTAILLIRDKALGRDPSTEESSGA
jgi:putative membrane protein